MNFLSLGDIDTYGFAMLDRLRSYHPHIRSLLMDEATLLQHRPLWGREPPLAATCPASTMKKASCITHCATTALAAICS